MIMSPASEGNTMYRRYGGQRAGIESVHNTVNALQVIPGMFADFGLSVLLDPLVEFPQVRPGAESRFQRAVQDESVGFAAEGVKRANELLQFFEGERADLVERLAMERQFNDAILQTPGQRFPLKLVAAQTAPFSQRASA
jgi:hypothetical protein